jgi:hypothetical protein
MKITQTNLQEMSKKAFDNIIRWNGNKDMILWAARGNHYTEHSKAIYPFASVLFGKYLNFKTQIFEDDCKFGLHLDSLDNLDDYNLIISVQYLEDLKEEFIVIKSGNLVKYMPEIQKKALIIECHTSATSDGGFIYEFMKSMEYHIENHNKLYLVK